ncbi:hypothetical protein ACTUVN_002982 [Pseudomonas caspiana]
MTLTFDDPANGFFGPCRFAYKASYVLNADADSRDQSVSARLPVDFETYELRQAPAFLHDIAPAGAAKRFLIAQIGRQKPDGFSDDLYLLAPVYDLAPMVMDAEGVTRTTKWSKTIERAGVVNWRAACEALVDILDPRQAFERLRHDAQQLRALPDILRDSGLPEATFNHPAIALSKLDQRLTTWGLQ